jgi:hypothetical protein
LTPGATAESTPGPISRRGADAAPRLFDPAAQSAANRVTRSGSLGERQRFEDPHRAAGRRRRHGQHKRHAAGADDAA